MIINAICLGISLSLDAFSISVANSIGYNIKPLKKICIAFVFGFFQTMMPLISYFILKYISSYFNLIYNLAIVCACVILLYIGIRMIIYKDDNENIDTTKKLSFITIIGEAVATSIDALIVGGTFVKYNYYELIVSTGLIGITTFIICLCGIFIGDKFKNNFSNKAYYLGGIILIIIGIKIFTENFILKI